MATANILDRVIGAVAPRVQLRRMRARLATETLRHYEAASTGRRTQNWNRTAGDANAVNGNAALGRLREIARDLVRNNPWAESALATLCDHTVGTGIPARAVQQSADTRSLTQMQTAWKAWAETTACDSEGRHDLYGLQKLVMRTVVESGECLVRKRPRYLTDGLPIPLQLQVMEPDMLDSGRTAVLPNGGVIVQGVEYGPLGDRVAYWLFPTHPGAILGQTTATSIFPQSRRIDASEILHVFKTGRPNQARAASWFANVILRLKELDEYEDATLMKQKIAACLAIVTTDVDGSGAAVGTADDTDNPGVDSLEPGAILNLQPGRSVDVVQPPSVNDYDVYVKSNLRAIATGLHVTYEDLTGDFSQVNFSSARMARLKHWARVEDFRWRLLIPQLCDPVWQWAGEALQLAGQVKTIPRAHWSPAPLPMIDPEKEGRAILTNARAGAKPLSESLREQGYDPDEVLAEYKSWNDKLDAAGVVLDSDPRKMTQAGQVHGAASRKGTAATTGA